MLHASAVAIADHAVLLVGASGAGKSTIAAALLERGHFLLADDTGVVKQSEGSPPIVLPGFPEIHLWPESILGLGQRPEGLSRLEPSMEKRRRRISSRFSTNAIPLTAVYLLAEGKTPSVLPLTLQEALVGLLRHTYTWRVLSALGAETHLTQCADLVNAVPVRRLIRPVDFGELKALCHLVEAGLS